MKMFLRNVFVSLLPLFALITPASSSPVSLKMVTPAGYLTNIPVLVQIEALDTIGQPDRELWDAEATLSASVGITLSTNRVTLRNGLGSTLVAFSGTGDLTLTATLGTLTANRTINSLASIPVTSIGGTLAVANAVWSGIVGTGVMGRAGFAGAARKRLGVGAGRDAARIDAKAHG